MESLFLFGLLNEYVMPIPTFLRLLLLKLPYKTQKSHSKPLLLQNFNNIFLLQYVWLSPFKSSSSQGWDSPTSQLCYVFVWLRLFQLKTQLEEKTVIVGHGESQPRKPTQNS